MTPLAGRWLTFICASWLAVFGMWPLADPGHDDWTSLAVWLDVVLHAAGVMWLYRLSPYRLVRVADGRRPLRAGDTVVLPCPKSDEANRMFHEAGFTCHVCGETGRVGTVEYIVAGVYPYVPVDNPQPRPHWIIELEEA